MESSKPAKSAKKDTKKDTRQAMPSTLRFEGHEYEIAGEVRPGVTQFLKVAGTDAPAREGLCATADLTDSGEGWCYLPRRVAPPVAGDVDEATGRWIRPPHPLRELIRARPEYAAGRDDLAIGAVETNTNT
jgi:hypothetical protein